MDDIEQLKKLAGVGKNENPGGHMSPLGGNISATAAEKRRLERENNIKPGTDEWFKLWFSRPYLTGEQPVGPKR
jgi:hypothetical protein